MADNSNLSVLIVDPNQGMRGSLQGMLNQSGITKIESAVSSGTAIKQLQKKAYDIILCEYDLGSDSNSGQDGQQLLEDLRHHKLIGLWTIFIMITSEGVYNKVISAAELTPNDYILKPFTVDVLSNRITRAIERRMCFLPTYQLIGQGNTREAIISAAAGENAHPRYAADFMRLRAELLVSHGDLVAAGELYQAVIDTKPTAWAQLGLARTLMQQQRFEEAQKSLEAIVHDNPKFMAAYDLLAQVYEKTEQAPKAQKVLEEAIAISPHMVRRLRHHGEVALEAGDPAVAEKSFKQVVAKAKYSEFRSPEDHVNLVRALVTKGDTTQAGTVIRDMEKSLRGVAQAETCAAIAYAMVSEKAGKPEEAADHLAAAVKGLRANSAGLSDSLRMNLSKTLLANKMEEEAADVMLTVVNDVNSPVSMEQAMGVFEKVGRKDLAESIGNRMQLSAQALLNTANEKIGKDNFRGAVSTLAEALNLAPGNLVIVSTLGKAVLRQIHETGWDNALAEQLMGYLGTVRKSDIHNPHIVKLNQEFAAAKQKYGIAT
jgi:DNA-binding NarL/FixJ family response regulator/Tfp pilus assembly protein PilF